jgi:peptidoglycan/LPS O-acetylase OafA/YrhL
MENTGAGSVRNASLDSVRGLAALAVLLGHVYAITSVGQQHLHTDLQLAELINPLWLFKVTPLRAIINGHAAVMLFFVLSGYVLAPTFLGARGPTFWSYVRQRLARLWLPCAGALFISAALYLALGSVKAAVSPRDIWQTPPTLANLGFSLLLTGRVQDLSLDPPLWSLVHEVRISLLFPLIALVVRRRPVTVLIASLALHLICLKASPATEPATLSGSWLQTGAYVVFFVAGFTLADNRRFVRRIVAALSNKGALAVLGAALLALAAPMGTFFSDIIYGLSSTAIIALVAHREAFEGVLQAKPCLWLGRVSFSLYLTHLVVFVVALRIAALLGAGSMIATVAIFVTIPVALAVAQIFHAAVERPAKALSARLARPTPLQVNALTAPSMPGE